LSPPLFVRFDLVALEVLVTDLLDQLMLVPLTIGTENEGAVVEDPLCRSPIWPQRSFRPSPARRDR
jgi:hypothetical protein